MNKVILMGRLVKDPEVRYSQSAEPVAVCKYTLAVNRRFKREGEPDADFINCVAFGKTGEFAEKYFKKGQLVSVVGSLRVRTWDNADGVKQWTTEVVLEEQHFAESKSSFESNKGRAPEPTAPKPTYKPKEPEGFTAIDESVDDDDLPF
jgi:single-strand DNA-binding protein